MKTLKLAVFDLDGTLSPLGKGMTFENMLRLRILEDNGVSVAVCSGKCTYYLCGYLRQVGLRTPLMVGENGAAIQIGIDLPPQHYEILPYDKRFDDARRIVSDFLHERFPDIWYQPNEIVLTPFPNTETEFDEIAAFLETRKSELQGLDVYRHSDSFDLVPKGSSKKNGLKRLTELLGIEPDEVAAVGDGVNDYSMFEFAGLALGINFPDEKAVDKNFNTIDEALTYCITLSARSL